MTLREKRDAVNAGIALLIVLAADRGPEIQEHVEQTLRSLEAMEKELYPQGTPPEPERGAGGVNTPPHGPEAP